MAAEDESSQPVVTEEELLAVLEAVCRRLKKLGWSIHWYESVPSSAKLRELFVFQAPEGK